MIIKKIFALILVVALIMNLLYIALGRITDFIFWLNLLVLFVLYFIFYGDKTKLKKFLNLKL